jgi:serine/threonine-protein kinase ATR
MQTIYSHLDEPDGIVGISEHINNPTLEQQILEHENLGKWDLALGCHELTLQKQPGSHASLGMLNCMKHLGQLGNVINHTHSLMSSCSESKGGYVTIGLEVSWRLRDWDSFGKINSVPNTNQTFDALVGQVLFAMQQNQAAAIEATMKTLLKSSTSSLMASTLETYERGYDSYINLHIIEELQAIQKIKPLLDCEIGFPRLREMFMIWDKRLSLTRPSIKSRELILNVRQSAIDILWYVTC